MTDEVEVSIPDPNEWRMDAQARNIYEFVQLITNSAINSHGMEIGISLVLSGVTREMRKHLSDDAAIKILQGFMDTMKDIRKYDR